MKSKDDDESSSSSAYCPNDPVPTASSHLSRERVCCPEDEPMKSSYESLYADVAVRCGYFYGRSSTCRCRPRRIPFLKALEKRELSLNWSPDFRVRRSQACNCGFSSADKVALSENFFPNNRQVLDLVHAKTFCVGYTDGGNGVMTASQDHKIRLYKRTGIDRRYQLRKALDVPYVGWSILDVAVSPDGRDLIYSTWNEAMYQCSIDDPDENWIPLRVESRDARFALFSIRFNSSGTEIVAGSTDRHLYIYNREACCCVLALKAHDDDVNAVCFGDASSNIILSGADDGLVKAWDRRTMGEFGNSRPVGIFAGHRDGITFIDSRGDDRYVLSNCKDQSIKVWDMRNFASDSGIEATKAAVNKQRWDYRYQWPQVNMWTRSLEGDCSLLTLRGHSVLHTLVRARFSPDHTGKRYIYTGCGRGNCVVYDIYDGSAKEVFGGHKSVVRDCAWSPLDNEIVIASWDGETSYWRYDGHRGMKDNSEEMNENGIEETKYGYNGKKLSPKNDTESSQNNR